MMWMFESHINVTKTLKTGNNSFCYWKKVRPIHDVLNQEQKSRENKNDKSQFK